MGERIKISPTRAERPRGPRALRNLLRGGEHKTSQTIPSAETTPTVVTQTTSENQNIAAKTTITNQIDKPTSLVTTPERQLAPESKQSAHDHEHPHPHAETTTKHVDSAPTSQLDTILKNTTSPSKKIDMCGNCQGTCPGCGIAKLDTNDGKNFSEIVAGLRVKLDLNDPTAQDLRSAVDQALADGSLTIGKPKSVGGFFGTVREGENGTLTFEGIKKTEPIKKTTVEQPVTPPTETAEAAPSIPDDAPAKLETLVEPQPTILPIAEIPTLSGDHAADTETTTPSGGSEPSSPDKQRFKIPKITLSSDVNTSQPEKADKQPPPVIDPRNHELGEYNPRSMIGGQAETPKGKKTADHAMDHAGSNNKRKQVESNTKPTTREIRTRLIHALPNILRAGIPQKEQQALQTTDKAKKHKDMIRARIEKSAPATAGKLAELANKTAAQILREQVTTITLSEQKRRKRAATEKQGVQKRKETKRRRQTKRTEVFSLAITGENIKLKKKKGKREIIRGKKLQETISLKKRKTAEKTAKLITRKRKTIHIEKSMSKIHERQRHQRRSILTEAGRAKIYEHMRARKRSETQKSKNRKEQHKIETTRPLILMIPKETPIEQIAGAITRIAKEKREKSKTPPVEINVSSSIFVQLKKIFAEAIITKSTKQKNSISIVCDDKRISLDAEKLKQLEHLFTDFETQVLLLQLRQCLIQSEIKEATVLCGCQQQDAAHTFEKITFCQGCHQGYIQQTFFWLTTIMWYTIYGMTLDPKQNQMYTQSYSYEQKIFTP